MMHANVLDHEPSSALFVPDEEPLLFYEQLASFAQRRLHPNGKIYFEINEHYGDAVKKLLVESGFDAVTLHQDLNGKDRIVSACLGNLNQLNHFMV